MKNLITKSLFIFALTGTSFAMAAESGTTIETADNANYRIVQLSDLNKEEIASFCEANMEGVILSIEGSTISFSVTLGSDLLAAGKHTPRKVKVMKPCFIKCEKGVHSFSSDYVVWKPFKEFFDNDMDVTFHIDDKTNLVNINLHIELTEIE